MSWRESKRFGVVKHQVMTDPAVSVSAKALYALLCCYADKQRVCWPSISRLADVIMSYISMAAVCTIFSRFYNVPIIKMNERRKTLLLFVTC